MTNIREKLKQADKEQEEKQKIKNAVPNSNQELFSILKQAGEKRRKEKEYTPKRGVNTGKTMRPRLTVREITNILEKYATFKVIGDDETELSKAPLYWYDIDNGIYIKDERKIFELMNYVDNEVLTKGRNEIYNKLIIESAKSSRTKDKNLVIVNNGIFDRKCNSLIPFDSKFVFTNKISTNYSEKANQEPVFSGWSVSKWFKEIADGQEDKLKLLWQVVYASIDTNTNHEAAIFLIDDQRGRTGKSTFELLIENLVGKDNCGHLKLEEFENDFKLALADSKAVIIGDDNKINNFNEDSSNFKSLVTGETMLINPKKLKPYYNRFNCLVIQSMNGVPRFGDSTDAHLRRIKILKFNHKYEATPENRKIKEDYINRKELREWLLYKALHSPKVTNFITTKESEQATHEIKEDNNAVYYFVNKYVSELQSTRLPVKFLFNYFMACMDRENNHQKIKQRTFTKEIKLIMTDRGWNYQRNSLSPLNFFDKSDVKKLDNADINYNYRFSYDDNYNKYQPLFEK